MLTKRPFSRTRLALVAAAAVAIQLGGCDAINEMLHPTPAIEFAPAGEGYAQKPDFAMIEHDFPLTTDELQNLTPDNLKNFTPEQIDQIYARLTAGPIPDGPFDGDLVFPKRARAGRRCRSSAAPAADQAAGQDLGRTLWKGRCSTATTRAGNPDQVALPQIRSSTASEHVRRSPSTAGPVALSGESSSQAGLLDSARVGDHDYFFTTRFRLRQKGTSSPAVTGYPVRTDRMSAPGSISAAPTPGRCSCSTSNLQQGDRRTRRPGFAATQDREDYGRTQARAAVAAK
jgi:hypothetical protein